MIQEEDVFDKLVDKTDGIAGTRARTATFGKNETKLKETLTPRSSRKPPESAGRLLKGPFAREE